MSVTLAIRQVELLRGQAEVIYVGLIQLAKELGVTIVDPSQVQMAPPEVASDMPAGKPRPQIPQPRKVE